MGRAEDVNSERFEAFIDLLSTSWNSRQAETAGAQDAAVLLREEFVSLGFDTTLDEYSDTFSPNVVAKKVGTVNPDSWVVIGAHCETTSSCLLAITACPLPALNRHARHFGAFNGRCLQMTRAAATVLRSPKLRRGPTMTARAWQCSTSWQVWPTLAIYVQAAACSLDEHYRTPPLAAWLAAWLCRSDQ